MKNALILNSRRTNEAVIHPEKLILAAAIVLLFAAAWFLFPTAAGAQTVTVGTVSGLPGTCVELPINFTAGSQTVMSVELDLGIPAALTPVPSCTGTASMSSERSI